VDTLFALATVTDVDSVTLITIIIILDPFCHISQQERKILSVSKNPYVFDVMPNNYRGTDWRCDCCIFCTHSRKIHETTRPNIEQTYFIIIFI